jgi:hypothetical protein
MRGTELACELVDRLAADNDAWRHIQGGVLRPELIDCGAPPLRIALAENLLKVATKQFVDSIRGVMGRGHRLSPV